MDSFKTDPLVTVPNALAMTGMDSDQLLRLINGGSLAAYRIGQEIKFKFTDLEQVKVPA